MKASFPICSLIDGKSKIRLLESTHSDGYGQLMDLVTYGGSLDSLYTNAQVNDSLLKQEGTYIFTHTHNGTKTNYVIK